MSKLDRELEKMEKLYGGKMSQKRLIEDLDIVARAHGVDMEYVHELAALLTWRKKSGSSQNMSDEVKK